MFAQVFESIKAGTWPSALLALANKTYVATWKNRPQNVYNLAAIAVALLIVFFSIRLGMAYLKSEIGKGKFAASASAALTVPGGARHQSKSSDDAETDSEVSPSRSIRSRKPVAVPKKKAAPVAAKVSVPKKAAAAPKKAVAKKVVETKAAPVKKAAARSVSPVKRTAAARSATPVRAAQAAPARATPVRASRAATPAKSAARSPSRGTARSTRSRK